MTTAGKVAHGERDSVAKTVCGVDRLRLMLPDILQRTWSPLGLRMRSRYIKSVRYRCWLIHVDTYQRGHLNISDEDLPRGDIGALDLRPYAINQRLRS